MKRFIRKVRWHRFKTRQKTAVVPQRGFILHGFYYRRESFNYRVGLEITRAAVKTPIRF